MDPRLITATPAGLDGSRPRTVRLASAGRALVMVIAMLLVAAPVVAILLNRTAINQREEKRLIDASAAVSDGVVTKLSHPSKDSKQLRVAYTFADRDGRTHKDQVKVPMRGFTLQVGDRLPIRFVESNPSLNVPVGVSPKVLPFSVPYIFAAMLALVGLLAMLPLRYEWHLLAEGRATRAVVKEHFKQQSQHGAHRSMRYEFSLLSGATASGKSGTGAKPPAIGSVVWVLYDSEHPRRNKLYPLSLVKLDHSANT